MRWHPASRTCCLRRAFRKATESSTCRASVSVIIRTCSANVALHSEQRRPISLKLLCPSTMLIRLERDIRSICAKKEIVLRDNQDDTRDNQDGKFLIGRFPKLLARI